MILTREFLHRLPKADLHIHLDGSLRVETVLDLARKKNILLPSFDIEELTRILTIQDRVDDLGKYIERFQITLSVMQDVDGLYRAAFELAEDAAKDNVRYMEVRYSPILHQRNGLELDTIVKAVINGLNDAERHFNIRTGIIICGIRNINPKASEMLAELAVKYKNRGVVAFDLAGVEYNYPAKDHLKAFYNVRNNNVNITLHAGEAFGPSSIHQAIHYCGAHRVGHGTRLIEDPDLLNYVRDHRIPLEVCLLSNYQTRSVISLKEHPFIHYLNRQLRVTLNTDNTLISGTSMTDEFVLAVETFNLSLEQVFKVILNGFKSVFLGFEEKVDIYKRINAELLQIRKECE